MCSTFPITDCNVLMCDNNCRYNWQQAHTYLSMQVCVLTVRTAFCELACQDLQVVWTRIVAAPTTIPVCTSSLRYAASIRDLDGRGGIDAMCGQSFETCGQQTVKYGEVAGKAVADACHLIFVAL